MNQRSVRVLGFLAITGLLACSNPAAGDDASGAVETATGNTANNDTGGQGVDGVDAGALPDAKPDAVTGGSDAATGEVIADSGADVSSDGVDDLGEQKDGLDTDDGVADGSGSDAEPQDGAGEIDEDAEPIKVCNAGETKCIGAKIGTCGALEDGWIESNCFPGQTCSNGVCAPVSNNLLIVFDTSGSMTGKVNSCSVSGQTWPTCDPTKACTRMDVSKVVFTKALEKIDDALTRMALFRFPQKLYYKTGANSCMSGYYQGQSKLSTDVANLQSVEGDSASWFWDSLNETACVDFPKDDKTANKAQILKWMNGSESMADSGNCGGGSTMSCAPVNGCGGTCCSGTCWIHDDPELRPTGGTPIGKTLFYVGEYLRNRVVVDGRKCTADADCGNVNYQCKDGICKDPARSCREIILILFTDGGESNSASNYFAPWVQAKRMAFGLGCQSDADCVGGTSDEPIVCTSGKCLPKYSITGYFCSKSGAACLPTAQVGEATHCAGTCTPDPRGTFTAAAGVAKDNVLRSPDGKPFGVRVHVVDISGSTDAKNSMSLAISGNGKLLGADAEDPVKFLAALESAFDIKNAKICGESF